MEAMREMVKEQEQELFFVQQKHDLLLPQH